MRCLKIIIILLVTAVTWISASTAVAWTRYGHGHHRHDFYHPRYHSHHGYIHDLRPIYSVTYTETDGWDLIEKNQSRRALDVFEKLSNESPAAGGPQLGIAIAAAETGELSKSVTAMRLALNYNPGVLRFFEPENWLKIRLINLVKTINKHPRRLQNQDAYFMMTAFYYILKDKDACLEAARLGRKANDTTDSALNLFYMAEKDDWRFH